MGNWEKLIQGFCEDKDIKACKTSKEVRKCLHNYIYPKYKGRVSDGKINAVIDDILESVCLKLNIDN